MRTSCCTDCAIAQVNIARFVRNQLALNPFRNNCCPIPSHIKERPPKKMGLWGKKFPATSKITTNLQQKKSRSKKVTIYLTAGQLLTQRGREGQVWCPQAQSFPWSGFQSWFGLLRSSKQPLTLPKPARRLSTGSICLKGYLSYRLTSGPIKDLTPWKYLGPTKKSSFGDLNFIGVQPWIHHPSLTAMTIHSVAIFQILVNHLSIALPATSHQEKVKPLKTSHLCIRQNQIGGIFGFNLN